MSDLFDEEFNSFSLSENTKPYHSIEKDKSADKLGWLNKVKDALVEQSRPRVEKQREHMSMYRGISRNLSDRRRSGNDSRRISKINKFVVNHLYDLTETKVSQMTRLKPAVEVLPANAEWEDRASAKVVGLMIKHLWTINNIDYLVQNMHRYARIFGEVYAFILWDESKGDLDPAYVAARDAGFDQVIIDGEGYSIDEPLMTGDVRYDIEVPWRVLLQRKTKYEDVEYCFRIRVVPTEDLKLDYPKHKDEIDSSSDLYVFDIEDLQDRFVEEHTIVYDFYHKSTKYLSKGKYICFTSDVILEEKDLPFSHGKLPMIRLTDMDVPDVLNGVSRYETVGPIQRMYDNINTLIAKNIYLTAHAKWLMPRGACKLEQLGNDNTIIQYQGPVPPTLAQVHSNPPEVYAHLQQLKNDMQTIYGSHGISRGEVPKGITAASALQFLNELENDRASSDISKHGFLVKELARMTIAVAGDFYTSSDGRLLRIVGENNKFLIRHFDVANLSKDYDVRFDNSTGLPETKSAKIQRLLETMQLHKDLFTPERWIELLDLGDTEKAVSLATEAIRSADSENEDIMAGVPTGEPEEWEDHIAHWRSHTRAIQSRSFKEEASDDIIGQMTDHIFWTEELMIAKAANNPLFQAQLAQLNLFPLFFHDTFSIPKSAEHQEATVQSAANRGTPISGNIPGSDIENDGGNK